MLKNNYHYRIALDTKVNNDNSLSAEPLYDKLINSSLTGFHIATTDEDVLLRFPEIPFLSNEILAE